jgi:hypothetical protein
MEVKPPRGKPRGILAKESKTLIGRKRKVKYDAVGILQ